MQVGSGALPAGLDLNLALVEPAASAAS